MGRCRHRPRVLTAPGVFPPARISACPRAGNGGLLWCMGSWQRESGRLGRAGAANGDRREPVNARAGLRRLHRASRRDRPMSGQARRARVGDGAAMRQGGLRSDHVPEHGGGLERRQGALDPCIGRRPTMTAAIGARRVPSSSWRAEARHPRLLLMRPSKSWMPTCVGMTGETDPRAISRFVHCWASPWCRQRERWMARRIPTLNCCHPRSSIARMSRRRCRPLLDRSVVSVSGSMGECGASSNAGLAVPQHAVQSIST